MIDYKAIKFNGMWYHNSLKYIPGDFIKFKGKYYQIHEATDNTISIYYKDNKTPKMLTVGVNDVTPIPLTVQFLLDNRWELSKKDAEGNEIYCRGNLLIEKDILKDRFYYYGKFDRVTLKYISDLQHLLFGIKFGY